MQSVPYKSLDYTLKNLHLFVNCNCVSQISKFCYVIENVIMYQLMRKITNVCMKYKNEMLYKVVSKSLSSLPSKHNN